MFLLEKRFAAFQLLSTRCGRMIELENLLAPVRPISALSKMAMCILHVLDMRFPRRRRRSRCSVRRVLSYYRRNMRSMVCQMRKPIRNVVDPGDSHTQTSKSNLQRTSNRDILKAVITLLIHLLEPLFLPPPFLISFLTRCRFVDETASCHAFSTAAAANGGHATAMAMLTAVPRTVEATVRRVALFFVNSSASLRIAGS